jgi:hypothetical protein
LLSINWIARDLQMTSTEFILLVFLIGAVGYIMWLEKQPRTDAEREAEEHRRDRLRKLKEVEQQKDHDRR